MSLLSFIVLNHELILSFVVILLGFCTWIYKFFKLSPEERRQEIQTILVSLTYEAEKALGGGVGSIKRSQVYNLFKKNYPFLASVTSMQMFDKLLDNALDTMKNALEDEVK